MTGFKRYVHSWNIRLGLSTLIVFALSACIPISVESQGLYVVNITCPTGWSLALNNCYLFNTNDLVSWDEARTECALLNADLMVIRNKAEQDWINIQTEQYQTDAWWVGLRYTSSWKWMQNGGDNTLINWRNEPDNDDDQDCCAINQFGLFSDEYCRSQLGFVCSYPIQHGDNSCPSGDNSPWLMTDSACFYISPLLNNSLHMTWSDAKTYCSNLAPQKGSQLMSVTTADNMMSLQSLLSSYDTAGLVIPWWTGLNDQQTEGKYVWTDGTEANGTLLQWDMAPSQDRTQNRNCGVMLEGGSIDDVTCNKRAHYVCEMSAYQGYLNLGCGSWLRAGRSCYLLGKGKGYTWNDAGNQCARAGAHLLKVDDLDEKGWVENQNLGPYGYWTGLSRAQNQYGWAWQDQSAPTPDYINWSAEPNNAGGQEDCVEIHKDGLYNDRQCDAKVGYFCEYPSQFGQQCLPGWSQCQQSCYYLSPANYSYTVTWYEAKDKCADLVAGNSISAYRLAVNDKDEQTCVNGLLQAMPDGGPGYWTDMSDLQYNGIWRFTEEFNNEPNFDVIPWVKEPNNFNNSENCAVMYNHGSYNDLNCQAKAYYICEKLAGTFSHAVLLHSGSLTYAAFIILIIKYFRWYL